MRGRAPGRQRVEADAAAAAAAAQLPPSPLAEQGGLGPEGGGTARKGRAPTPRRWQPQGRSGRGRGRRGRAAAPGLPVTRAVASFHTRPQSGDRSHRAPMARMGRAKAAKPRSLRSGPPLPRGLPARPGPGKSPSPSRAGAGG